MGGCATPLSPRAVPHHTVAQYAAERDQGRLVKDFEDSGQESPRVKISTRSTHLLHGNYKRLASRLYLAMT
jgi:hypothetical protein